METGQQNRNRTAKIETGQQNPHIAELELGCEPMGYRNMTVKPAHKPIVLDIIHSQVLAGL